MNRSRVVLLVVAGILGAGTISVFAAAKVDEQTVAPIDPSFKYVVSRRGVHVAAIVRKGIHWEVKIDGANGPRIDAVLTPTSAFVDPRTYQNPAGASFSTGRYQLDQIVPQPVIFNRDGTHSAYLARVGNEWVLYKDQQAILRLPASGNIGAIVGIAGSAGNTDIRMQFAGQHDDRLLFAESGMYGYNLWVDGQKWPGGFTSTGSGLQTSDPIISPDGEHIAYPAQIDQQHRSLVIDGKVAGYYAENLTYTSDSLHLLGQTPPANGGTILEEDGKRLLTARMMYAYYCAPKTDRVAAVLDHHFPNGQEGQFLVLDGKPVPATLCHDGIQAVVFSSDGQHFAAVCQEGQNHFVVEDGKKVGDPFDTMGAGSAYYGTPDKGIAFSPGSDHLLYVEHGAGKYVVVDNGEEGDDAFDRIQGILFSSEGGHSVYIGDQNQTNTSSIVIDGKTVLRERSLALNEFGFSPDGTRYADIQMSGNYGGTLFVDGKATPVNATGFQFSPDSKHIAAIGYRPSNNVNGLWLDGNLVYKGSRAPAYVAFSADSRHIFWCALEPDPSRTNGNYNVWVTYADGQPVARSDAFTNLSKDLVQPAGYSEQTVHPGWQPVGDSGLACVVATVSGEVDRDLITPTDTSLDTVLAGAKGHS